MRCDGDILRRGFLIANQVLAGRRLPNPLGAAPCEASEARVDQVGARVSAKTRRGTGNCLMEIVYVKSNLIFVKTIKPASSTVAVMRLKTCRPFRMNRKYPD